MRDKSARLVDAGHVRLRYDDVKVLKQTAEINGTHWQVELRSLVHRALRGELRSIPVLSERP